MSLVEMDINSNGYEYNYENDYEYTKNNVFSTNIFSPKISNKSHNIKTYQELIKKAMLYNLDEQIKNLFEFARKQIHKGDNEYLNAILDYRLSEDLWVDNKNKSTRTQTYKGATFLILASTTENKHIINQFIKLLEDHNLTKEEKKNYINTTDEFNINILMYAAFFNQVKLIKYVLNMGAKINHGNIDNVSALLMACEENNKKSIKLLLKEGADPNIKTKDHQNTSLMQLAYHDEPELIKIIINKGADINTQNISGWTALMVASQENNINATITLIKNNANPFLITDDDQTALSIAQKKHNLEIFNLLVEYMETWPVNNYIKNMKSNTFNNREIKNFFVKNQTNFELLQSLVNCYPKKMKNYMSVV